MAEAMVVGEPMTIVARVRASAVTEGGGGDHGSGGVRCNKLTNVKVAVTRVAAMAVAVRAAVIHAVSVRAVSVRAPRF